MLPECRTLDQTFAIPTFDVSPRDVEGFGRNSGSFKRPSTTVLLVVSRVPISSTLWWAS